MRACILLDYSDPTHSFSIPTPVLKSIQSAETGNPHFIAYLHYHPGHIHILPHFTIDSRFTIFASSVQHHVVDSDSGNDECQTILARRRPLLG
jgi:hypothetical protein